MPFSNSISQGELLIAELQNCCKRYFIEMQNFAVAYSGGKDSLVLCLLLKALGIKFTALTVDLGYGHFNRSQIAQNISKFGIYSENLAIANPYVQKAIEEQGRVEAVNNNLKQLADVNNLTPCTACSSTKRQILYARLRELNINTLFLAHHKTDFVVTGLKDYWTYLYYRDIGRYDPLKFRSFIAERDIDLKLLEELVIERIAGTMPIRFYPEPSIEVLRPLAFLSEQRIIDFKIANHLQSEGSGCSHDAFYSTSRLPPSIRELVHSDLHHKVEGKEDLENKIFSLLLSSLDNQGKALFNPRESRDKRLVGFK